LHASYRPSLLARASSRRSNIKTSASSLLDVFKKKEPLPDQLPSQTLEWLQSRGLPKQELAVRDVGVQGRGLVAAQRIRAGDALLRIPRGLVLTAADATAQSALGAAMEKEGLPAWSVLALFLVETRMGRQTDWGPYADILPKTSGSVLEWREQQVNSLGRGTQLHTAAREILQAADKSWQGLEPVLRGKAALEAFGGRQPTREDFQWAFSMLLSRVIRLPGLHDMEALVPWADLLNHSCESTANLDWDGSAVVFRPDSGAEHGEQLFGSYGAKSSGQLLLSYGFVQEGVNPWESVTLKLKLSDRAVEQPAKAQALKAAGLKTAATFPLRLNAFPAGLLEYAAVVSAPDSEALQSAAIAAANSDETALSQTARTTGLKHIREACRALADEPTARFEPAPASGVAQQEDVRLEQLIAEVRAREKRILNRAIFLLTQMIRETESRQINTTILAGFLPPPPGIDG